MLTRLFDGNVSKAFGFTFRVGSLQRDDGTCNRWLTVETDFRLGVLMEPEAARQLAAASTAAADEIDVRR